MKVGCESLPSTLRSVLKVNVTNQEVFLSNRHFRSRLSTSDMHESAKLAV